MIGKKIIYIKSAGNYCYQTHSATVYEYDINSGKSKKLKTIKDLYTIEEITKKAIIYTSSQNGNKKIMYMAGAVYPYCIESELRDVEVRDDDTLLIYSYYDPKYDWCECTTPIKLKIANNCVYTVGNVSLNISKTSRKDTVIEKRLKKRVISRKEKIGYNGGDGHVGAYVYIENNKVVQVHLYYS